MPALVRSSANLDIERRPENYGLAILARTFLRLSGYRSGCPHLHAQEQTGPIGGRASGEADRSHFGLRDCVAVLDCPFVDRIALSLTLCIRCAYVQLTRFDRLDHVTFTEGASLP